MKIDFRQEEGGEEKRGCGKEREKGINWERGGVGNEEGRREVNVNCKKREGRKMKEDEINVRGEKLCQQGQR